jgi:hypothetical protein
MGWGKRCTIRERIYNSRELQRQNSTNRTDVYVILSLEMQQDPSRHGTRHQKEAHDAPATYAGLAPDGFVEFGTSLPLGGRWA